MNIIKKRADEILKNSKQKKSKKLILENTIKFSKKNHIKIIDSRIDYLTIKLNKDNGNIIYIEKNINKIYSYDDIGEKDIDLNKLPYTYKIFDKFIIINNGYAFGEQKKIYSIYDSNKNKVAQLILKNSLINKSNKNVINSIEFKGLFFKSYKDYLYKFFELFNIDTKELNIIKRIDYCIDIIGIEVFEILEYLKDIHKETKNVKSLPGTDKKKLLDNDFDIKYGKKETYKNFFSNHNDLKIYDKILDLLQPKNRKRKVNGVNPYQDYIDSNLPIIRIELKKKKFQNLHNHNYLERVFQNIEALFFDYCLRFFDIDLSLYKGVNVSLNGKKTYISKEKKDKSLYHAYIMAQAYMNNIKELAGEKALFKFLHKVNPNLDKTSFTELVDEMDISDYFLGISDDLLNIDYENDSNTTKN